MPDKLSEDDWTPLIGRINEGKCTGGHLSGSQRRRACRARVKVGQAVVVYFKDLISNSPRSRTTRPVARPGYLQYILFGAGTDLFLAHLITKPPDFDQILPVMTRWQLHPHEEPFATPGFSSFEQTYEIVGVFSFHSPNASSMQRIV